jgi:hypothetical protein
MGWFGYVFIVWIDKNGNGLDRVIITPDPGKALKSTAITGPDGTFLLPDMPRSVDSSAPVTVEFEGADGPYRSTVWTPTQ